MEETKRAEKQNQFKKIDLISFVNDVREQVVFQYKKSAEIRKTTGGQQSHQPALREGH